MTRLDLPMPGQSVQAIPGTPPWLAGARFGEVLAARAIRRQPALLVHWDRGGKAWLPVSTVLEC